MAELKTQRNDQSVENFLNAVTDEKRRQDCYTVLKLMKQITRAEPEMWGNSIVGFGSYRFKYASGREGDWPLTGFSPRQQNLTLYILSGFSRYDTLMNKLGKYKTGKSCLYVNKIEDIDLGVLGDLIKSSAEHLAKYYK
jgi:hypothetical protein